MSLSSLLHSASSSSSSASASSPQNRNKKKKRQHHTKQEGNEGPLAASAEAASRGKKKQKIQKGSQQPERSTNNKTDCNDDDDVIDHGSAILEYKGRMFPEGWTMVLKYRNVDADGNPEENSKQDRCFHPPAGAKKGQQKTKQLRSLPAVERYLGYSLPLAK
jgi:hypothetical protein